MPEHPLINVELSDQAKAVIASLPAHDRRTVVSWLDHLRNWNNDSFLQSKAKPLRETTAERRMLSTSTDYRIVFDILGDRIIVLAVFHANDLNYFKS
jgi:mRNA-degrading endonuclease RelE of RelBE toxin-antitoxin system